MTKQLSNVNASLEELVNVSKQPQKQNIEAGSVNRRVQFNVGGKLYSTSFLNVTKESSILQMVCVLNPDQPIFIDRDSEHFDLIMEYFRGNKLPVTFTSKTKRDSLLEEAEFYEIKGLIEQINKTEDKSTQKKLQEATSATKSTPSSLLSEGFNLMTQFEEEIQLKMSELSEYLQLGSSYTKEQNKKIRRYFGWTPVKLDVGGVLFEAGEDTLSKIRTPSGSFVDLFSKESDGTFFIDRDPSAFHLILRNLREQTVSSASLGKLRNQFQDDLLFYGLDVKLATLESISFTQLHNLSLNGNSVLTATGGSSNTWDKNAKSDPLTTGKHSLSVNITQSSARNIMFGCGPDRNIQDMTMYTGPGKYLYLNNSTLQGAWTTSAGSIVWGAMKVGDTVTLELDIDELKLTAYYNNQPNGVLICNVPQLPEYYFYLFIHDNNDSIKIVDRPF